MRCHGLGEAAHLLAKHSDVVDVVVRCVAKLSAPIQFGSRRVPMVMRDGYVSAVPSIICELPISAIAESPVSLNSLFATLEEA